jgi:hypothetical protein
MICVKCGHQNSELANFCEQCNAKLPRLVAEPAEPAEQPPVQDRLRQLEEAARKVLSEEWSREQFAEYVENVLTVLQEKERAIREIEIPSEAMEDFREELEVGFVGISLYNQGLERMLGYVEDGDASHLDEGLDLVRQGNDHINEAMRINRENRRKLEEMYIDSSPLM